MPTRREQVQSKAIEILLNNPQGIRYSELVSKIKASLPGILDSTIAGSMWNLDVTRKNEVYKAGRGLFRHVSFKETQPATVETTVPQPLQISEERFYEPFADYLQNDLEDCTKAKALGGKVFGDKWGTPDVIGIEKTIPGDIVQRQVLITSAEIKTDSFGLITAFGQACAYKSFSHKVWIVIPKSADTDDKQRIESLCLVLGIGLIFFDSTNFENPQWEIRVRPLKQEPDMFYVNRYMEKIKDFFS
jgi:hypothetical protein